MYARTSAASAARASEPTFASVIAVVTALWTAALSANVSTARSAVPTAVFPVASRPE